MGYLRTFGHGEKHILAKKAAVPGTVTAVKTCWWMKVNQKPFRTHSLDGAAFPHMVSFRYTVDGKDYTSRRFLNWTVRCPAVGGRVTVWFDPEAPARCALSL